MIILDMIWVAGLLVCAICRAVAELSVAWALSFSVLIRIGMLP